MGRKNYTTLWCVQHILSFLLGLGTSKNIFAKVFYIKKKWRTTSPPPPPPQYCPPSNTAPFQYCPVPLPILPPTSTVSTSLSLIKTCMIYKTQVSQHLLVESWIKATQQQLALIWSPELLKLDPTFRSWIQVYIHNNIRILNTDSLASPPDNSLLSCGRSQAHS